MKNKKYFKKTLLIDLDGVLNNYVGNYDKDFIPPIKFGAKEFLRDLSKNYVIKIFTTRNSKHASKWIEENGLNEFVIGITNVKEPCWVYIDDRCITFDGKFEGISNRITKNRYFASLNMTKKDCLKTDFSG